MSQSKMISISNSGTWTTLTPIPGARSHSPPAVYGGKIYFFGGGSDNFASMNSVYAYNPATDKWEKRADMPTKRSGSVATVVGDSIYVMGGGFKQPNGEFRFLTKVEIYHPITDTWTQGPDLLMPHDYPAVAFLDGKIYVLGGHHPEATKGGPKTDPGFDFCERLDITKGKWEQIASLSQPRFALAAVNLQGKILAMGGVAFTPDGFNNFTLIESYDPVNNDWVREQVTLPWPAAGLGACSFNNRLYIFGGYSSDNIHNRAATYNPDTKTWQRLPDMPSPRAAMGVAVVNQSIYLLGGWADDGRTPQDTLFSYDAA